MAFDAPPPPSYERSTSKQWLIHVAPYIHNQDLARATRVCAEWTHILLPYLWGDFAAHFPPDPEEAQLAFLKFRRGLSSCRHSTRCLAHTFRIPAAFDQTHYQPDSAWRKQIVDGLPNLQSVVLPGLHFVDHDALAALQLQPGRDVLNKLRLLSLTRSQNATTAGLMGVLSFTSRLLYLDLTGTRGARHVGIFDKIGRLKDLKVLKIADLALGDDLAANLFSSVGTRVQYLDIANNDLTDRSVESLSMLCLRDGFDPASPPRNQDSDQLPTWMRNIERADVELYRLLTSSFANAALLGDIRDEGLQALNISQNNISYTVLLNLVNCGRLQALNCGNCRASKHDNLYAQPLEPLPSRLTYLRVPHPLVTGLASSKRRRGDDQAEFQSYLHTTLDTVEQVEAERQSRISELQYDVVAPALHPRLRSLVISDIPARSVNRELPQAFIQVVKDCALEWRLATLQTRLDYRLPPGTRDTTARQQRQTKLLFALAEITLELVSSNQSSGWTQASDKRSMTGDADSEALWDAYASDFSFFGDEASLHTHEERMPSQSQPSVDTIAEISTFRKKVKEQYELALSRGEAMPKIDGYWEGTIKVLRS